MIKQAISSLVEGHSLSMEQAATVMEEIMEGAATPSQLGAFLAALRIKGETPDEIAGLASAMQAKAVRLSAGEPVLDIVGTGGDGLNTFNISTAACLVTAAAGVKVAKHGNRAASGRCGSADVLEKLGVKLDLTPEQVHRCISEVGIGFMFAPVFHPAMKFAGPTRKEIAIRTVFNILGPLTNPAVAEYQVIGVPTRELAEKIVRALLRLRSEHSLVVYGENGMDELSISGPSRYWEIVQGKLQVDGMLVSPEDVGLTSAPLESILGDGPQKNAQIILDVLRGDPGPQRDVVALNAAAGLQAAGRAGSLKEGVAIALMTLEGGKALTTLERLISCTARLSGGTR